MLSVSVLAALLAAAVLLSAAAAVPTMTRERWVDPCRLTGSGFSTAPATLSPVHLREIYLNIQRRARVAHDKAEHAKNIFVYNIFKEPEWEAGVADLRQQWLPRVPPADLWHLRQIPIQKALMQSYEFLQYFGVGLEQILVDQVVYRGKQERQFVDLEGELTQILCELQIGMRLLGIEPNPDVTRLAMNHKYRVVPEESKRNLRNFLILRDFIKMTDYISRLFAFHASNLTWSSTSSLP